MRFKVTWFPWSLEFVPGYLGGVLWYLGLVPGYLALVPGYLGGVLCYLGMVEVVYRYDENLGVEGPKKNKNKKDVGLPMTMPQVAGENVVSR